MIYKYSIVIFINKQKVGLIINIKQQPHITVKRKFQIENIEKILEIIKKITDQHCIFELKLGKIKEFADGKKYISIKNNSSLNNLHQALAGKLESFVQTQDPQFEKENFVPHLTLENDVKPNINSISVDKIYLIEEINHQKDKKIIAEFKLNTN